MKSKTETKKPVAQSRQKIVLGLLKSDLGEERLEAMHNIWGKMQFSVILGEMLNAKTLNQFQDNDYLAAQLAIKMGRRACFPTRKEDIDRLKGFRKPVVIE